MMDMLPFPRITNGTPESQIGELLNYLIQLKETLEFALMNISAENLSPDLVRMLESLGANIRRNEETREDDLSQLSSKALSITVNYDTGHLEYNNKEGY